MTLLDLASLVFGFAVAFALGPAAPTMGGGGVVPVVLPAWFVAVWLIVLLVVPFGFAVGVVVLIRRLRYGGLPRPAEWLSLLIVVALLDLTIPNVDDAVNGTYRLIGEPHPDFGVVRWAWAGTGMAGVLAGLALLLALRKTMPSWAKTLLLVALAWVLLWGPIRVFAIEFPYLSWLFHGPSRNPPSRTFWLYLAVRRALGELPRGLIYGVPIVAALLARRREGRPGWTWTEWAGAVTTLVLLPCWLILDYTRRDQFAERAVLIGWIVVVALLSWAIVRYLGPAWNRWIGIDYDRP